MIDPQFTLRWVMAVLSDPASASVAYRETEASWQQSFLQLTLPLYVLAYIVAAIVALVTGGSFLFGSLTIGIFIFSLVWGLAWTLVIAFIFDYLAGVFGGRRGFDAAYALVALAIIPAAIGTAVNPLPWLGWLLGLAAGIYSLVLAYRFLPLYLEIPEGSRVKHFALSIAAALVVNILVSLMLLPVFGPAMMDSGADGTAPVTGGMLGGFERQAEFADAASKDTYRPPEDGRLTDRQVRSYVDALGKTQVLRERLMESMKTSGDSDPSLSEIFSGVGGAVRLSTAEMEVVKSAGGNWAEHQWVGGQIETARIQQDLNETTAHNYALFKKYQQEIEALD
ncbi:MAG: YIP1 family protein [Pseudomonadales bacterium]|nr:YIP1 family protein [Pseudomonadales bacterium]